jgi:superfamily I DNA/RNA helicase
MLALLNGVEQLVQGEASTHPDLLGFSHWAEFKKAAEQDGAPRDMQQLVKVVNNCPRKTLRAALTRGTKTKEAQAEWVFSTAHKSKGREWVSVYLGDDFPEPDVDPDSPDFEPEEARLAYVAITRAQYKLRGGQAMLQAYTDRLQRLAKRQSMQSRITKLAETLRHAPPDRQQALIAELNPVDRSNLIQYLRANEQ